MACSMIKQQEECSFAPKFDQEYSGIVFFQSQRQKAYPDDGQQNYLYSP